MSESAGGTREGAATADPRPYVARNGNRFTPEQAKLITEPLRYEPTGAADAD